MKISLGGCQAAQARMRDIGTIDSELRLSHATNTRRVQCHRLLSNPLCSNEFACLSPTMVRRVGSLGRADEPRKAMLDQPGTAGWGWW